MAGKKILLVEGADDEHVLKHLCTQRGHQKIDTILPHGGVERLLESFPVRLKESDIEALGVLIDADTDLHARWDSLRHRLSIAGYLNVPNEPDPAGTILSPPVATNLPRVGVWLMPNNQTRGILEDFLRFLVPSGSALFTHAQSSVAGIPPDERRFTELAEPKAILHTWLAWQKVPGLPFGTAITARFLNSDVPQVDLLVAWLKRLFFP